MPNEEHEKFFGQARKPSDKAERDLFETYLTIFRKSYGILPRHKRIDMLQGLSRLIQKLEKNEPLSRSYIEKLNTDKAKKTREKTGLTQAQLAEVIMGKGNEKKYQSKISDYENGKSRPERTKFGRKYLEWLTVNNYDN